MKAFIYIGGELFEKGVAEAPEKDDLVLAADAGYRNALKMRVTPSVILGDFDSLGDLSLPNDAEILRVPAEKDDTDTALAVKAALERGATELVLIGGLGGRLDHTLANLALLEALNERRIRAVLTNGKNRVRFIRNDGTLLLRGGFRYFSLLPADPVLKGVSLDGCKYPLKNAKIQKGSSLTVSNEIVGNCALIEIKKGGAWIVESND